MFEMKADLEVGQGRANPNPNLTPNPDPNPDPDPNPNPNPHQVGQGRAGVNIRNFMSSVRGHHVQLDPSVMVRLMSMMVLEGWH